VSDAKREAERAAAEAREASRAAREEAEADMAATRKSGAELVRAARDAADRKVAEVEKAGADAIARTEADATERIEAARADAERAKAEAAAEVASVRDESARRIQQTEERSERKIAETEADAAARIRNAEEEKARRERELRKEADDTLKAAKEAIAKRDREHEDATEKLLAEKRMTLTEKEREHMRVKRELEDQIKGLNNDHRGFRLVKEASEKDLNQKLDHHRGEEHKFRSLSERLERDLQARDAIKIWVNTTQLKIDVVDYGGGAARSFSRAYLAVLKASIDLVRSGADAVIEVAAPHYEAHLAEHVNQHAMPIWREKVLPLYEEVAAPAWNKEAARGSELAENGRDEGVRALKLAAEFAKDRASALHRALTDGTEDVLGKVLTILDENGEDIVIPKDVTSFLRSARRNPDGFVDILLKVGAFLFFVAYLRVWVDVLFWSLGFAKSVLGWGMVLPYLVAWKVFWFLCPLRLLIRRGGAAEDVLDEDLELEADAIKKEEEGEAEDVVDGTPEGKDETLPQSIKKEGEGSINGVEENGNKGQGDGAAD